jgi:hypothetical protein
MHQGITARGLKALALAALLAGAAMATAAGPAHAGQWMRINCVYPDGSAAPSDGWRGETRGSVSVGSVNSTECGPNKPMIGSLSNQSPASSDAAQLLRYTPPDGSTLVGGTAVVGIAAEGYGAYATATAAMHTPDLDESSAFLKCVQLIQACQNGLPKYYGTVELPRGRGGSLYLAAGCLGVRPNTFCSHGGSYGAWSLVSVYSADLLLSTDTLPSASDFRGGLLEEGAHGTAGLAFTAADSGPGVHKVIVTIDDKPIYDATPNTLSGKCVPVGTDPATGALKWAWQQPCPRSQTVDLTVKTTTLRDGPHELKITVRNAARDSQTVLRRTITTNNRTTVSSTLTSDRVASIGLPPAPIYAMVLDAPTQKLVRGARHGWTRSGVTLSGTVRNAAGVPAPGVLVTLFAQNADGGPPEAVARATTDAAGHWTVTAPRGPSRTLAIVYGEQPDPAAAHAIKIRQTVKPAVSLNVRALGRGRLRFSGRVRISPLGSPRPLVVIQTRNGKRWQAVGSALRVSKSGRYAVTYNGGPNVIGGSYVFRTVAHATSLFATGISRSRRTVVR